MIGRHNRAVSDAENSRGGQDTLVLPDLGLGLPCCEDGDPSRDATKGPCILCKPRHISSVFFLIENGIGRELRSKPFQKQSMYKKRKVITYEETAWAFSKWDQRHHYYHRALLQR
jgi:hypothetical protein